MLGTVKGIHATGKRGLPTCPARPTPTYATKHVIRTVQNHFIAALCSVDPEFPIHLWERLVPLAKITLINVLRGSRINPKLSAWAKVHGTFDFKAAANSAQYKMPTAWTHLTPEH
jgi:hypothetical protein